LRELVKPLDMTVIVFDPAMPVQARASDVAWVENLDELLMASDIVSLHCPLTDQTRGLIGARQFELMKRSAFLINTARGPIVNELELIVALKEKKIAGAGLDTFAKEPPEHLAELSSAGKTLLTPHLGAATQEAFVRMGVGAAQGIVHVLSGNAPDPECHVNRNR
jgi:D-3-phosphoglycerate dehydrogenase